MPKKTMAMSDLYPFLHFPEEEEAEALGVLKISPDKLESILVLNNKKDHNLSYVLHSNVTSSFSE